MRRMKAFAIALLTCGGFSAILTMLAYHEYIFSSASAATDFGSCNSCISESEMSTKISAIAFSLTLVFIFSGVMALKTHHKNEHIQSEPHL
jgi:hypothetical protein